MVLTTHWTHPTWSATMGWRYLTLCGIKGSNNNVNVMWHPKSSYGNPDTIEYRQRAVNCTSCILLDFAGEYERVRDNSPLDAP